MPSQTHRRSRSRERHKHKHKKHKEKHNGRSSSEQYKRKQRPKYESKRQQDSQRHWGRKNDQDRPKQKIKEQIVKQLPCWQPSGILLQFYNNRQGVSLKFHQPAQARKPQQVWRIYIFKGQEVLNPIQLAQSCYLIGKDDRVCDILCENPSISRQHAVIQFRMINKMTTQGQYIEYVKPYVMDLGSTNSTFLNDQAIEPQRYYQLLHKDVLRFGLSDRQYVMVHDETAAQQRRHQSDQI